MSAIPAELIERPEWVNGEPGTKIPINAKTGGRADTTDPTTWATITAAQKRADRAGLKIGFVFSADDGLHGLDLDHCRDPETGWIEPWARAIVDAYPTYWEISTSGTGLHGIGRGTLPAGGHTKPMPNGGKIEMYDRRRYFIVTGDHLESTPEAIQDTQDALEALHSRTFPPAPPKPPTAPHSANTLEDNELIERMMLSANGFQIRALMDGSTDGHNGDDSAADLALCSHLMFWTGNDKARTDKLFRQSGLYRTKWERCDYREATLEKAMAAEVYTEPRKPAEPAAAKGTAQEPTPIRPAAETGTPDTFVVERQLSESANALRLARRHGETIRYCKAFGQWLLWDGTRWKLDDTGSVVELVKDVAASIYREAADAAAAYREDYAKWARRSHSLSVIKATATLAQSLPMVAIRPDDLDADPWLFNVLNGTINLKTGDHRPHDRANLITKVAPVRYDASATCPTFLRFLERIIPNTDTRRFLQRFAGCSLTGDTREDAMAILYGGGRNGKTIPRQRRGYTFRSHR